MDIARTGTPGTQPHRTGRGDVENDSPRGKSHTNPPSPTAHEERVPIHVPVVPSANSEPNHEQPHRPPAPATPGHPGGSNPDTGPQRFADPPRGRHAAGLAPATTHPDPDNPTSHGTCPTGMGTFMEQHSGAGPPTAMGEGPHQQSGCGAVGSAPALGAGGRRFESGYPDEWSAAETPDCPGSPPGIGGWPPPWTRPRRGVSSQPRIRSTPAELPAQDTTVIGAPDHRAPDMAATNGQGRGCESRRTASGPSATGSAPRFERLASLGEVRVRTPVPALTRSALSHRVPPRTSRTCPAQPIPFHATQQHHPASPCGAMAQLVAQLLCKEKVSGFESPWLHNDPSRP